MARQILTRFVSFINNLTDKQECLLNTLHRAEALSHVATGTDLVSCDEKIVINYNDALLSFIASAVDNCEASTQELLSVRKNIFREILAGQSIAKNCRFILSDDDITLLTETISLRLKCALSDEKKQNDCAETLVALNTVVGLGYAAVMSSNSPHNELQHCLYQEHLDLFLQARDTLGCHGTAPEIIANCIAIMIDIASASFSFAGKQYFDAFRNSLLTLLGELHQSNEKISKIVETITLR